VLFIALVTGIVFVIYGSGWAERVPKPNQVRSLLIGAVVASAIFANLTGRVLFRRRPSLGVRELLSGAFVAGVLLYTGFSFAGRYLGGNAIPTPDASGFHYLMYEGWGMMFIPLCIVFGFLAMLREGYEEYSYKK
jgi:hypothetical protein